MNEVDFLKKLAAAAQKEDVPELDVTRSVLAALREREQEPDTAMAWIAGLSSAAAIPAAIFGFFALQSLMDPAVSIFWVIRWGAP